MIMGMSAKQNMTVLAEICRLAVLIVPETDGEISAMDKIFGGIGDMQECFKNRE